jgi:hypothetical protein
MAIQLCDKSLMTQHACLHQMPSSQVLAMQVYAWGKANGLDLTTYAGLNAALKNSACLECFSDKQIMDAVAAVELSRFDTSGLSDRAIAAQIVELDSMPNHRNLALLAWLKCKYFATH